MILKALREFDSGVADALDNEDINLEKFEIVYIKRQLEKKLDDLIPFFPDLNPDSDDPKVYNLISTFRQSLTHVLAVRKKTSEELAETVLSTVEDVYRELNVSGVFKRPMSLMSCRVVDVYRDLLNVSGVFDNFFYFEKSYYLKKLKKGNNPVYNVNGVKIQMDRYYYQMKPYRFNYLGLSLFSKENLYEKKFDAIKDKYNPELSLLMETIIMKKDIYLGD